MNLEQYLLKVVEETLKYYDIKIISKEDREGMAELVMSTLINIKLPKGVE